MIYAADLFCGAGGTSTGLLMACEELGLDVRLLAINHWNVAIDTHTANHPKVSHLCETLDSVDPRKAVLGGRLDLLWASPECTHHSNARGGKPISDQTRATAWHICRWADALRVEHIIIENVREFRDWGPLDDQGRRIKTRKGTIYQSFLENLRALGYTVEDRILNAADYGDATTRRRLFIQARLGRGRIRWPEPTHLRPKDLPLDGKERWRPAREIIDWENKGESIYTRKRPLAPNTMRRIMAGLRKYSGLPFIVPQEGYYRGNQPYSAEEPLKTVTSRGAGFVAQPKLVPLDPFVVPLKHMGPGETDRTYGTDVPLPTLTTKPDMSLIQPFLVVLRNHQDAKPVDGPVPTLCANGEHVGICEPFLVKYFEGSDACPVDAPLPTITANYEHLGLVQPFIVNMKGKSNARGIEEPLPTQTAGAQHMYLAEPYLVKYNNNGGAHSVDQPMPTITTKDRVALVMPEVKEGETVAMLDIRFRMLTPEELARAMSFPEGYEFAGNRSDKVRQIGNAVPVMLSKSLCRTALEVEG